LLGTWEAQAEDPEVKQVSISRADENTYAIKVIERGSMYALETDDLEAWVTEIGKASFLFAKPHGEDKYYHYQYAFDGKDLVTNDVSLLDGGVDAVTSTETLRAQVAASMKMEGWAEEKITWVKQ
jgi:hypothetical protein